MKHTQKVLSVRLVPKEPSENLFPSVASMASWNVCNGPSGMENISMPRQSKAPPMRMIPWMASAQMTAFRPPIIE